ncbi:hypothetical protein Tco_1155379 [Tanacetum coccineum]
MSRLYLALVLTIGKATFFSTHKRFKRTPSFRYHDILITHFSKLTAVSNVLLIYLHQFRKSMSYNEKTRVYSCQVDEQWFDLSADLLRKALAITPVIPAHVELTSAGNTGLILVLDKKDLAKRYGKSYSRDPEHFSHTSKHKAKSEEPKEEITPLLTLMECESVEVFGMAIPDPLITEAIQQSSYYPKYLEMVAENTKKTPQESASMQPATKRATPKKPITTTPVKQSKPAPPPSKKSSKRKLPQKVRKGKPAFQLVDEDEEAQLNLFSKKMRS